MPRPTCRAASCAARGRQPCPGPPPEKKPKSPGFPEPASAKQMRDFVAARAVLRSPRGGRAEVLSRPLPKAPASGEWSS
eukprot:6580058-Pyramimonas_sp.AAC.1